MSIQVDAAGSNVADAVAADFDGNGTTDLAVLTCIYTPPAYSVCGNSTLIILLNDGRGNLHSTFTYKVPQGGTIGAGDINGDTLPDIVFVKGGNGVSGGTVTPYLSTHGGALMKGTTYSVPTVMGFVKPVIADINNDGHGDVAVPTSRGTKFLMGSSGGQLTSGTTINSIGSVVLADFNKDGKVDVAVGSDVSVFVYFGSGNGAFSAPRIYSVGTTTLALFAGDFYGAGNMDLVTFGQENGSLYLLRNPGDGYFSGSAGYAIARGNWRRGRRLQS